MQPRSLFAPALALALVTLCVSCEDSPFIAPEGSTITVSANPATVRLDLDETEDATTIRAQLLEESGLPLEGASVFFSSTGGTLQSGGSGVETDASGFAIDELTITAADDGTIEVTARSGAISDDVTVSVDVVGVNQLPVPSITASPSLQQGKNQPVTFTGTSTDPDNPDDAVTCWCWAIESLAGTEIIAGSGSNVVSKPAGFPDVQTVDVTLLVSDVSGIACQTDCNDCAGNPEDCEDLFGVRTLEYSIVCDTSSPVAEAGTNQTVILGGAASVPVSLNGSSSSDPQSGITSYAWACGNGTSGSPAAAQSTCTYTTTGVFTVQLVVTNGCGQTANDTLTVTVN